MPLRELMVIKVMDKCQIYNRRCVDTILNEQKLLSELMHPFLGNLRYSFQDTEKLYIVTDYLEGGDLGYYMHVKKKKFTENQAKFIIANIIIALEFVHGNGVIHRDVRPENVVFNEQGYLSLIDFGLARVFVKNNSADTSGTPCYMAPEILLRQNYSYTSDFFGLGVILHEIMTRKKPYRGPDRVSYKEQVLEKQ